MTKVQVWVEIPEGYELVSSEPRIPLLNEEYIDFLGDIYKCNCQPFTRGKRWIVRKKWQWPEWLTANYVAQDQDGNWYAYTDKPNLNISCYLRTEGQGPCCAIKEGLINIQMPKFDRWQDSLMANPHKQLAGECTDAHNKQ